MELEDDDDDFLAFLKKKKIHFRLDLQANIVSVENST